MYYVRIFEYQPGLYSPWRQTFMEGHLCVLLCTMKPSSPLPRRGFLKLTKPCGDTLCAMSKTVALGNLPGRSLK